MYSYNIAAEFMDFANNTFYVSVCLSSLSFSPSPLSLSSFLLYLLPPCSFGIFLFYGCRSFILLTWIRADYSMWNVNEVYWGLRFMPCLLTPLPMPRLQNHGTKATRACSSFLDTKACALGITASCPQILHPYQHPCLPHFIF